MHKMYVYLPRGIEVQTDQKLGTRLLVEDNDASWALIERLLMTHLGRALTDTEYSLLRKG